MFWCTSLGVDMDLCVGSQLLLLLGVVGVYVFDLMLLTLKLLWRCMFCVVFVLSLVILC